MKDSTKKKVIKKVKKPAKEVKKPAKEVKKPAKKKEAVKEKKTLQQAQDKKVKEVKAKKPQVKKTEKEAVEEAEDARYIEAIGRRKTSVARVRVFTRGEKEFIVNDKPYKNYFPTFILQQIATASLRKMRRLGLGLPFISLLKNQRSRVVLRPVNPDRRKASFLRSQPFKGRPSRNELLR